MEKNWWKYVEYDDSEGKLIGRIEIVEDKKINSVFLIPKKVIDGNTGKNTLFIEVYSKDNESELIKEDKQAEVQIDLKNLVKDLIKLRDYGVLLQAHEMLSIANEIETNYHEKSFSQDIISSEDITDDTGLSDEEFEIYFYEIADYILLNKLKAEKRGRHNLYLIESDVFDGIFNKNKYNDVNVAKLKQDFKNRKYTHCHSNRPAIQIKRKVEDGSMKMIRYIAFFADKIDEVIKE